MARSVEKLTNLFYSRFFELALDPRHLFPDDKERQPPPLSGHLFNANLFQSLIRHSGSWPVPVTPPYDGRGRRESPSWSMQRKRAPSVSTMSLSKSVISMRRWRFTAACSNSSFAAE